MARLMKEWILAALLHFAPVDTRPQFPGFEETAEDTRARYASIAEDIGDVAETKNQAALLIALAIGETGLSHDADKGPCYRGKPGGVWWTRCDSGTSATLWQLKPIKWEGELLGYLDLFKDRKRAASIALWAAGASLKACRNLPPEDRLSQYGSGKCVTGLTSVRARHRLWLSVRGFEG